MAVATGLPEIDFVYPDEGLHWISAEFTGKD